MNIELRRILLFLAGLLSCFILFDFGVGLLFDSFIKKMPPEGERVAKSYYAINKVESDIVVIGSSRAETGYDCSILKDSLPEFSFFNCGGDGQDFFYCNAVVNAILDRYTPKAIIWDFKDRQLNGSNIEDLSLIYPYYWQNSRIRSAIDDMEGDKFKYLVRINAYRYNATAGRILRALLLSKESSKESLGFVGLPISNNSKTIVPKDFIIEEGDINPRIVEDFTATAQRIHETGCKLFVVISPMYNEYNQDNFYTSETRKLCENNDVVFIDDSHLPGFVHNNDLAYDNSHLNIIGAQKFTKELAGQLKNYLGEDRCL